MIHLVKSEISKLHTEDYPRKHVKYFKNHASHNFSKNYIAIVLGIYTVLKFLHKPWDIGEDIKNP